MYDSLDMLQVDVDDWIRHYNEERSHCGKYCFGKTTMQTWTDSKELAKEKRLDQLYSKAQASR